MLRSRVRLVCAAVLVVLLAGCAYPNLVAVTGSGNLVTQEETYSNFDSLEISSAFDATIRQGEAYRTVITVDDNVRQYLRVQKVGNTLKIGLDPVFSLGRATLEADITMPALAGLDLSGASRGAITGFESGERFNVTISGASRLAGDIEAGDARIDASGASTVELEGSAEDITVDASGASTVDLGDFSVNDAGVQASGASRVTVSAGGRLDADASGASRIYYVGSPTMGRIDSSGASSIERR